MTHKFCTELDRIMNDPKFSNNKIYHYCLRNPSKKANAAYLMGAFQVLVMKRSAVDAWTHLAPA
jgi:cell division cycle 14